MGPGLQEADFDFSFWTLGGAVVRQFQGTKPSFYTRVNLTHLQSQYLIVYLVFY